MSKAAERGSAPLLAPPVDHETAAKLLAQEGATERASIFPQENREPRCWEFSNPLLDWPFPLALSFF